MTDYLKKPLAEYLADKERRASKRRDWKNKAIARTKGSQFGAILACALDKKTPAPYFSGKASVTSDGFVMCAFCDKNGNGHSGALVGSLSDLIANVKGVSAFLKLKATERGELVDAITGWISNDYSNTAVAKLEACK